MVGAPSGYGVAGADALVLGTSVFGTGGAREGAALAVTPGGAVWAGLTLGTLCAGTPLSPGTPRAGGGLGNLTPGNGLPPKGAAGIALPLAAELLALGAASASLLAMSFGLPSVSQEMFFLHPAGSGSVVREVSAVFDLLRSSRLQLTVPNFYALNENEKSFRPLDVGMIFIRMILPTQRHVLVAAPSNVLSLKISLKFI